MTFVEFSCYQRTHITISHFQCGDQRTVTNYIFYTWPWYQIRDWSQSRNGQRKISNQVATIVHSRRDRDRLEDGLRMRQEGVKFFFEQPRHYICWFGDETLRLNFGILVGNTINIHGHHYFIGRAVWILLSLIWSRNIPCLWLATNHKYCSTCFVLMWNSVMAKRTPTISLYLGAQPSPVDTHNHFQRLFDR